MGSGERLEIQTEILNSGEDAFNALLEVQVPRGLNYINANTTDAAVGILCSPPTGRNNKTLVCEVGNPLRAGKKVRNVCGKALIFFDICCGFHRGIFG
jgi:hypothetical protein